MESHVDFEEGVAARNMPQTETNFLSASRNGANPDGMRTPSIGKKSKNRMFATHIEDQNFSVSKMYEISAKKDNANLLSREAELRPIILQ